MMLGMKMIRRLVTNRRPPSISLGPVGGRVDNDLFAWLERRHWNVGPHHTQCLTSCHRSGVLPIRRNSGLQLIPAPTSKP